MSSNQAVPEQLTSRGKMRAGFDLVSLVCGPVVNSYDWNIQSCVPENQLSLGKKWFWSLQTFIATPPHLLWATTFSVFTKNEMRYFAFGISLTFEGPDPASF